jgi:hypothetical protein
MTKHDDKGRRAKLMFELVAAADRRIEAGLNTLQPGMFGENDELIAAAVALAAHLRTNPDEPDSALVAEVARLRGYLEKIRNIAIPGYTTALIRRFEIPARDLNMTPELIRSIVLDVHTAWSVASEALKS